MENKNAFPSLYTMPLKMVAIHGMWKQSKTGSRPPSKAIYANILIGDFFKKHALT